MYRQLITEASARELAAKYYPSYDDNFILWIMKQDPSIPPYTASLDKPFGTYTKQLLAWAANDSLPTSDYRIRSIMTEYDEVRKYLPPAYSNVNKFKTFQDLEAYMTTEGRKAKGLKAAKESSVLYEDDSWIVRIPKTFLAARFYGREPELNGGYNAEWCTSESPNHWNHYDEGTIFMILHKERKETSVQLYLPGREAAVAAVGGKPALMSYADKPAQAGTIPPQVRALIEQKFGVDLSDLFGFTGESAGEFNRPAELSSRFTAREEGNVLVGTYSVSHHFLDEEGDKLPPDAAESVDFFISEFDYRAFPPSFMVGTDQVNFTSPGFLVSFPNGGADPVRRRASIARWPDVPIDDTDDRELRNAVFSLVAERAGLSYILGPHMGAYQDGLFDNTEKSLPLGFVMFVFPSGLGVSDVDSAVMAIRNHFKATLRRDGRYLPMPSGSTKYNGDRVDYFLTYPQSSAYGGLKDALQDPAFAEYVQGALPSKEGQ